MDIAPYSDIADFLDFSLHNNDIQALLDRASHILRNPTAIFDENYYTVAYSDTRGVDDDVWLGGKERGYCLYEYAAMLHGVEGMRGQPSPFQVFDDFGPHRRRISPLISNAVTIGYLTVLEYNTELNDTSWQVYDLVVGVLTKELALDRTLRQSHRQDSTESLLVSLLNTGFANRALFRQRVLGTEFEKKSNYLLISIDMKLFRSKTTGEGHLKNLLGSLFSRGWSVFYRHYVVLLIAYRSAQTLPEDSMDNLRACLQENGISGGVSDPFDDLYEIKKHFDQAVTAEKLARSVGCGDVLAKYDDYKLWDLAASVPPEDRERYLSVFLRQLHSMDEKSNTSYVLTLFTYLRNNLSLAATARELHVHRNTVIYRIDKMKQLFNGSFDSAYCNLQNFMGCLLLMLSKTESDTGP